MISCSLAYLARWGGGVLISGVPSERVSHISTDTRTVGRGDAFLALSGENFDGHKFIKKAAESGAGTLIVSDLPSSTVGFTGNIIHVRDTLRAFQDIALNYRRRVIPEVIGIGVTGSNGKTSTKDFVHAVLNQAGDVQSTAGNLNNHIGLPMTVLATETSHHFGVWEMGMNHPGEIGPLAEIAEPDAAIVTNVGTAHIEHMKTREAIADEKGALPRAVKRGGYCVMPATDDYFDRVKSRLNCEMVGVGGEDSSIRAEHLKIGSGGIDFNLVIDGRSVLVSLSVPGRHMVTNALLAAAVGYRQGLSIEQISEGLSTAQLTGGRVERVEWRGVSILNDSYNANPDSVKAAVLSLMEDPAAGRKIAVLGFMGELGVHEESAHKEVGAFVAENNVDLLVTVSEKARLIAQGVANQIPTESFDSRADAAAYLKDELRQGDCLLVKGSRAAAMEQVIDGLNT